MASQALANVYKLRDIVNVRAPEFGAKGDGVTDDAPAIQSALDTVSSAGGAVYIPRRTFLLASFRTSYYLLRAKTGVSVVGDGPQSVLKVADGLRSSTQGIAVLYDHDNPLANILYSNFTVDWNGANNVQPSPPTTTSNLNRFGGSNGVKNIHIRNVHFKDSAGHHHIWLSDAVSEGTNPHGNCSVSGCVFQNAGQAIAGNAANTDHSSIFLDAPHSAIDGNMFVMDNLNDTVATAIEVHDSAITVTGNTIYGYAQGANIAAELQSASGVVFSGNTMRAVTIGIRTWTAGSFLMSDLTIANNNISVREIATRTSHGIIAQASAMASSVNAKRLMITGNQIRLETQGNLTILSSGISLQRWDDVTITGNAIANWVSEAINVQSEAGARKLDRYLIVGNRINGCGVTSTAANKRAIVFNSFTTVGTDDIDNVEIRNNQIICDAPAGTVATFGIQFNTGRFPNVEITDNTIEGAATSPITKGATTAADKFIVRGEGPYRPFNLIRASLGSTWVDTGSASTPKRTYRAIIPASDGNSDVWRVEYFDTAAPTSGAWIRGDYVRNSNPAVGQPIGWMCTVGGSPGTWVAQANL